MDIEVEIAKKLLEIKAVQFRTDRPFVYTSGMKSPIYCDMRLIMSYPEMREIIIKGLIQCLADNVSLSKVDVISGTATAAVPFASWIADRLYLPMVYVRDKAKGHGLENMIEGTFKKGSRVAVIEDIVSSGKSSLGNIKAITETGGEVMGSVSISSYEMESAKMGFEKVGVPYHFVVSMRDVVRAAVASGYLKKRQGVVVEKWLEDPLGWAQEQGF